MLSVMNISLAALVYYRRMRQNAANELLGSQNEVKIAFFTSGMGHVHVDRV